MTDWGVLAQWLGLGLVAVGLGYSFYRNGKATAKAIDIRITKTDEKIDTTEKNLIASISKIQINCAGVTAAFAERLNSHEKEIENLKPCL